MAEIGPRALVHIERELERVGLLFQHDREYPSFTLLAVGEPIRGSWWSHPRAHEIYRALLRFEQGSGALSAKVVSGKITYVHRRLWPALVSVARSRSTARTTGLSAGARHLRALVNRKHVVRADELARAGFASSRELTAAIVELEQRLLVHTESVHTESGAHAKLLRSWSRWCADRGFACPKGSFSRARTELEEAALELTRGGKRPPRLPW